MGGACFVCVFTLNHSALNASLKRLSVGICPRSARFSFPFGNSHAILTSVPRHGGGCHFGDTMQAVPPGQHRGTIHNSVQLSSFRFVHCILVQKQCGSVSLKDFFCSLPLQTLRLIQKISFFKPLNEVRRNVKVGTSVEWKVMISVTHYSHSHTGTLQHISNTKTEK